jgi:hypothetical protein
MLGIDPLGGRRPQATQATSIKGWVAEAFSLADAPVLVTELRCTEEGCPPLETVIVIMDGPGQQRQYKLHKAMADVTQSDIAALAAPPKEETQ